MPRASAVFSRVPYSAEENAQRRDAVNKSKDIDTKMSKVRLFPSLVRAEIIINSLLLALALQEHTQDEEVNKLLLLGAGESGKSTLFKQMIQVRSTTHTFHSATARVHVCSHFLLCRAAQIYGKGFPESERKTFIPIIHNNVITSMKTLVQQAPNYGTISADAEEAKRFCDNELKGDEEVDERVAQVLATLWKDDGVQAAWQNRSKFQLMDSAMYFFEKILEVCAAAVCAAASADGLLSAGNSLASVRL